MLKTQIMKNLFILFLAALFLTSCDDGDLIVTEFNFEDQPLELCGNENTLVLYNINTGGVNEAIALNFSMSQEDFLANVTDFGINLNQNNQIIYRTFDAEVEDYFCSQVPPAAPNVVEEYRSTSGGVVVFSPIQRNIEDHDGDGVPSSIEMTVDAEHFVDGYPDTDGDGIPNYLDIDDDGDNVRTQHEIAVSSENTANGYPDTDGDGIPDYLDADDDGDGTITRYEDLDRNMDPRNDRNDAGVPNYLNSEIVDSFQVDTFIANPLSISYRYFVDAQDLTLVRQGGDGEQIRMETINLGYFDAPAVTISDLHEENGENGEENGEEEETDPEDPNPTPEP